MADALAMNLQAMLSAAQFLARQADALQSELDSVTHDWAALSSTWTGVAASAFDPPFDEWHDGAAAVTSILQERSHLLTRSVSLMAQHETVGARALGGTAP